MEDAEKKQQTPTSLLASATRDFLLSADGTKVPISELEGKMVAIYFYYDNNDRCREFSRILSGVYSELKGRGEPFEVVLIFINGEEEDYEEQTRDMPWLLLPFRDTSGPMLITYFDVDIRSNLVLLAADGTITIGNLLPERIREYGARGYPFSSERIEEAKRVILAEQTLESLLVHGDRDYVLGKHGSKVPVRDLLGKTVLIFYPARYSGSSFTQRLVGVYEELRAKQCEVEVIFGSEEDDRSSFDKSFSEMPWLALPFGDERRSFIPRKLKLEHDYEQILVAIDPSGRTIATDAVQLLMTYGAKAFPFTDEHIRKLQQEGDDGSTYAVSITDYKSFLLSQTDYLVRNNGDQVNAAEAVEGKTIGLYVANLSQGCREFTPTLAEAYDEIKAAGGDFEVVFVHNYMDEDSFGKCFSGMPWLAMPFTPWRGERKWQRIYDALYADVVPHLSIVDGRSGEMVLNVFSEHNALALVEEYGRDAFPFTPERVAELQQRKEDAKKNQTVTSVLASATRDFVLTADGTKVPVSELEGKMVAIFFYNNNDDRCWKLSPILSGVYSELKGRGEPFEVVTLFYNGEEEEYEAETVGMPWLLFPFRDQSALRLRSYFSGCGSLVLLGAEGKTVSEDLQDVVKEYGARAYPFSSERIAEAEREMENEQTLESLLVHGDLDYVLAKDGSKVPVKDLVGKTVLIYYTSRPYILFTQTVVDLHEELRSMQCEVEVLFVSEDEDYSAFDESYSYAPASWLALPFRDERRRFLYRKLKIYDVQDPVLVAIDPSGRTITNDAMNLVHRYGAEAFPFTDEQIKKLQPEEDEADAADDNVSITDCKSFLLSQTDYLVRSNGDQVNAAEAIDGKTLGLYITSSFQGSWEFTATLSEAYNEIKAAGGDFEVVFVQYYMDEDSSRECFSRMPWLAVPFTPWRDQNWWRRMYRAFGESGVPHLAVVDGQSGEMLLEPFDAQLLVDEYGGDAFPFTPARVAELQARTADAKRNQTVTSVLASATRDFVLSADGSKVPVSELEGKMVAIFFYNNNDDSCRELSRILSGVYSELKGRGEPFEVVTLFFNGEEDEYESQTIGMPWLLFPFRDQPARRLLRYFYGCGTLVLLGTDGKTVNDDLQEIVKEYGARAYPFSSKRIAEVERQIRDEQTLESLLVYDDLDYVLGKDGAKIPVKDLVGKTVLILFSAFRISARAFVQRLAEVYEELRSKQCEVEVIFLSRDDDQDSCDMSYSEMPWLALPYGDARQSLITHKLKLEDTYYPILAAIDPSGRTIRTDADNLVEEYGAKAFPFTDEHIKKLQQEREENEEEEII